MSKAPEDGVISFQPDFEWPLSTSVFENLMMTGGSLESSSKVQDDGFLVCFGCAQFDQELRTIQINAHPNFEGVVEVH